MAGRGRPKTDRGAGAKSTFIRLSADELDLVQRSIAKQTGGALGDPARLVASFGREAMLEKARRILGEK